MIYLYDLNHTRDKAAQRFGIRSPITSIRALLFHFAVLATFVFISPLILGCTSREVARTDPQPLNTESTYRHVESGMALPVTVGGFRRVTILHEAVDQLDAAEYTLAIPHGTLLAHVYIYPAVAVPAVGSPPGTLPQGSASLVQKDFETHKLAVIQSHPGIQSVFESQVATALWDYPRNGKLTSFEYQDPTTGQALRKDLWIYPSFSGRWAIRYLFTYPKEHNAAPEIADFQRGVPLMTGPP